MTFKFGVAAALAASVSIVAASGAAEAACGALAGTWHFHALEVGPGPSASAIRCVARVAASGGFSSPCVIFDAGGSSRRATVSGHLAKNGCDLTGSISVPGDSPVVLRYAHLNGNVGAGVGTQAGAGGQRVLHFNLVRQ
jgi:hypothetical protein